ncbi:NDP-hexose 2,3-dehydratase family protein [Sphaerisporangium sp. NPDC049002]|uniref:NDP-hexose 2,3-dehydratase family protein n=1 Tax=unclassified Sphaerisporangium TaxID=2630420 RepID=UPI0034044F6E
MRIAESALSGGAHFTHVAAVRHWLSEIAERAYMDVDRLALDELDGWRHDPATGNIVHRSGGFFTVEGLDVRFPGSPVTAWTQPIINQPEVGILGILVKEFDGVLHLLMQAKNEPGNHNGLQLSPTVQATRSNYTRVHQGRPVPYLDHFRNPTGRVLADVRQSEQGAWFYRKRNRNMVVEVAEDIEPADGFCWLTLGQVHELLSVPDLVNMDARTVLACLPFSGGGTAATFGSGGVDGFRASLIRSCDPGQGGRHRIEEILSWTTGIRSTVEIQTERIPLNRLRRWRRTGGKISHETGRFFDVIGVSVAASGREVGRWTQPMIEPIGRGVIAFLVRKIGGVLHALVNARVEPGNTDVVELAPTVQYTPGNYDHLPPEARPLLLDEVLGAPRDRIRFDTILSEEGGRFYHARNRYLIVETDTDPAPGHPGFRWLTLHQLGELLRHSYYVNVQARTLSACLYGLTSASGGGSRRP